MSEDKEKKTAKLKSIFEDYAELKIPFEKFEHEVQSLMKFSKSESGDEKKIEVDYNRDSKLVSFSVNVSTDTIVKVLQKFLEKKVAPVELENWANTLIMGDHFVIANNEPSTRRNPALEVLHEVANWLDSTPMSRIQGYIASIKENS